MKPPYLIYRIDRQISPKFLVPELLYYRRFADPPGIRAVGASETLGGNTGHAAAVGLRIALLDSITVCIKVLTRNLEDGPVGQGFHLMGLTRYMPDDIAGIEALLMMLPNLGIDPSMDELAGSNIPRLIFEEMIVHAGLGALPED
jgi:hypothetical protein